MKKHSSMSSGLENAASCPGDLHLQGHALQQVRWRCCPCCKHYCPADGCSWKWGQENNTPHSIWIRTAWELEQYMNPVRTAIVLNCRVISPASPFKCAFKKNPSKKTLVLDWDVTQSLSMHKSLNSTHPQHQ